MTTFLPRAIRPPLSSHRNTKPSTRFRSSLLAATMASLVPGAGAVAASTDYAHARVTAAPAHPRSVRTTPSTAYPATTNPRVSSNSALHGATITPRSTPTDAPTSDTGETIIITGTRETGKRARDSVAPLDIVTSQQIARTGQPNLRQALGQLLPSLTLPTGGFDSGALTSSFSLRGLNPNETLVLVDGKRRHTTANLYADPGPQQGTTPVDIDMIPLAAIDHVEVLRDGASAQYGSDAVAGVVNVILKKQDHGFNAQSITGINAAKDGFQQGVYLGSGPINLLNWARRCDSQTYRWR